MYKNVSVAFGGGAARGLVHIGIIKYLEEKGTKIDEISGTSMGAVIGALYACGNTSSDIEKIANELKIFKLVDFGLNFGFIKGKKVIKKLQELFGDKKIEDLDIALKIVATNLETGEREVFTKGKIVDAIRASISLPGVFIPHQINGKTYIDGGIVNNLPVDILEGDNIIGISALKQKYGELSKKKKFLGFNINKSFFVYNYEVLHRTVLLMMKQNEDKSTETSKSSTVIIKPDFGDLDYYSFDKINQFIDLGYNSIKKKAKY